MNDMENKDLTPTEPETPAGPAPETPAADPASSGPRRRFPSPSRSLLGKSPPPS